jgi:hypothetical protein
MTTNHRREQAAYVSGPDAGSVRAANPVVGFSFGWGLMRD